MYDQVQVSKSWKMICAKLWQVDGLCLHVGLDDIRAKLLSLVNRVFQTNQELCCLDELETSFSVDFGIWELCKPLLRLTG